MAARSARLALGGCAAVLALAACSAGPSTAKHASPAANRSSPRASGPATPAVRPVVPGEPGAPPRIIGALSPAQLVAAYDTGPLYSRGITGKGQTIVIILPFGSPTIRHDLAVFDKAWVSNLYRILATSASTSDFVSDELRPIRNEETRVKAVMTAVASVSARVRPPEGHFILKYGDGTQPVQVVPSNLVQTLPGSPATPLPPLGPEPPVLPLVTEPQNSVQNVPLPPS